jgi:hypothetical protein
MSTLPLRATQPWTPPSLARLGVIIAIALGVFAEAQRQARDADARYPFME